MEATITLRGTPEELRALLPQLAGLEIDTATVLEDTGWTSDLAAALIDELPPRTREIIEKVVVNNGQISTGDLRDSGSGTLRGRVGPIAKAMQRMERQGRLPEGLPRPVRATYAGVGKAAAIEMPAAVLSVFTIAVAEAASTDTEEVA